MRLAQAARNLSITTDDIVTFLAKNDIVIEKDSNTKLDEVSIDLLFEYFDTDIPAKKEESIDAVSEAERKEEDFAIQDVDSQKKQADSTEEEKIDNPQPVHEDNEELEEIGVPEKTDKPAIKENELSEEEPLIAESEDNNEEIESAKTATKKYKTVADLLEEEQEQDAEIVIKAPKVSLQGLNVLGKIELPEPKPKQEKEEVQRREKKEYNKNRSLRKPTSRSNRKELTPQQLREREKKKELRRREEAEKRAKKKREAFYKEQVLKPKQEQQKKKKPKQKKAPDPISNQAPPKPVPKSLLGKFWRWLNT